MPKTKDVLRTTDDEARELARQLLRATPLGTLATLTPGEGWPGASLVTIATDIDGTPLMLISSLSGHTQALQADSRCSLLLARTGHGDPLAHPRISLQANARFLDRNTDAGQHTRRRFLARHAKAALYADFGDFSFVRLEPDHALLNGGFGKAYHLERDDLLITAAALTGFAEIEASAVTHMNGDYSEALDLMARAFAGASTAAWRLTGVDPLGFDLIDGMTALRIKFEPALTDPNQIHARFVAMTREARIRVEAPGKQ